MAAVSGRPWKGRGPALPSPRRRSRPLPRALLGRFATGPPAPVTRRGRDDGARFATSTQCTLCLHLVHCAHLGWIAFLTGFFLSRAPLVQERQPQAAFRLSEQRREPKAQDCRQHCGRTQVQFLAQGGQDSKMTHHLTWGGKHNRGYIALLHPNELASRQPWYLALHRPATSSKTSIPIGLHALVCRIPTGNTPSWLITCSRRSYDGLSRSSLSPRGGPSHCSLGSTLVTPTSWDNNSCTTVL